MSDRIVLSGMRFEGHHGASEEERELAQTIELDVELELDLAASGRADDLTLTVDYGPVIERCRQIVEVRSFHLLEAIAEAVCADLLTATTADRVTVRVRKLAVPVDADIDFAAVEMSRSKA